MSGNATTNAILDNARVALPGVADDVILLALYNVCDDLAREALRRGITHDVDADPATWLPAEEWVPNFQALLAGTLAALYGQFGKPYFQPDLAKANLEKYLTYRTLSRQTASAVEGSVNTYQERLVSAIRAQISSVRDEAIKFEQFTVISDILVNVFRQSPPQPGTTLGDWLTVEQYQKAYLAVLYGTLSRLYGQTNMAWFNLDQQKAQHELYQQELAAIRATEAADALYTDTPPRRIVSEIRAQIPQIRIGAINLEMFAAVDCIRREALRIGGLDTLTTDSIEWLTPAQWQQCYQAALHGTLYRLYQQPATPWYSDTAYQAHLAKYNLELQQVRAEEAGSKAATDSIPERVVSAVRAQIQLVRDEAVKLEMFNIIEKIRDEAYQLDPLKGADTNYALWLTTEQYEESYLAILYGTLSRLYGQSNMPWFNLDLYGSNNGLFLQELDAVRSENVVAGGGIEGILSEARTYLPGASEEVMQIELRRCMDEFFKVTQVWQDNIVFKARPGKLVYDLAEFAACGTSQIVRVISLVNSAKIGITYFSLQNIAELTLSCEPSQPDKYTATLCYSLLSPSACSCQQLTKQCGCNWGVPDWIMLRWNEVFFDGLLWRMMMQPAKPYTNTEIGLFHGQRWREGLADARGAAKQQNVYDGQRWRFPAFA